MDEITHLTDLNPNFNVFYFKGNTTNGKINVYQLSEAKRFFKKLKQTKDILIEFINELQQYKVTTY